MERRLTGEEIKDGVTRYYGMMTAWLEAVRTIRSIEDRVGRDTGEIMPKSPPPWGVGSVEKMYAFRGMEIHPNDAISIYDMAWGEWRDRHPRREPVNFKRA